MSIGSYISIGSSSKSSWVSLKFSLDLKHRFWTLSCGGSGTLKFGSEIVFLGGVTVGVWYEVGVVG